MQNSRCTCSSSVPRVLQLRARMLITGEEVVEDGLVEMATADDGEQVQPCRHDAPSLAPLLHLSPRAGAAQEVVVDDGNSGRRRRRSLYSQEERGSGNLGCGGLCPSVISTCCPALDCWAVRMGQMSRSDRASSVKNRTGPTCFRACFCRPDRPVLLAGQDRTVRSLAGREPGRKLARHVQAELHA